MAQFPAAIDLRSLDGSNGFRLDGVTGYDRSGFSVAVAGDVNGDGFGDLIVGAYSADPNGNASGSSYLVFGKASGFGAKLVLSKLDGTNGFRLDGVSGGGPYVGDASGFSVAGAGDVNGDGFDDLIIGAINAGGFAAGASYVVFGKQTNFAPSFDLANLNGRNGFALTPKAWVDVGIHSGHSVAGAEDINGDGFADLIIGAPDWTGMVGSIYAVGMSYAVFGKAQGFPAEVDLSQLDGTSGFKLAGVAGHSGSAVDSVGDINGDGFDDMVIGAPTDIYAKGQTYVVFGKAAGLPPLLDLASLDGVTGFRLDGTTDSDLAGGSVAGAGDINGDGLADLIIGARGTDYNGGLSGSSYVVFGKASGFSAVMDLSGLDGATGFRLDGEGNSRSGDSVASAGDFNGDGFDDVIIGAYNASPRVFFSGSSFVVFGKAEDFDASIDLASLDGSNGFRIDGLRREDFFGRSVAGGDINGDGFDDLIIGAPFADPNGSKSGSSYVVFGHRPLTAVIITGTSIGLTHNGGHGDDKITARGGNDILKGWEGNDILDGNAGDDVIDGATGNDRINGGTGKDRIAGGSGSDTLAGGGEQDRFMYSALAESRGANVDVIIDFDTASDRINLRAIDAIRGGGDDAFVFQGMNEFTAEGQLRFVLDTVNDRTDIQVNRDSDTAPEMTIRLEGLITLDASDFIL